MKRVALVRHLKVHGCEILRERRAHTLFVNMAAAKVSTVPRTGKSNDFLARKICRDLDVPVPGAVSARCLRGAEMTSRFG